MTAEAAPQVDPKNLNLNIRDPPHFYLSTIQSSTASFHSVYANFTASNEHNLILKYLTCLFFNANLFLAKAQKSKFMTSLKEESFQGLKSQLWEEFQS